MRKASKPREIGFNTEAMNQAVNSDVVLGIDRYEGRKVARRMFSVFDQLATNARGEGQPTLTKLEAVAGNNMFALYAVWRGLGGMPDGEDVGYVQMSRSKPELVNDRMLIAGKEWADITGKLSRGHAALIGALCHDMLTSDGAMIDTQTLKPVVRWRRVCLDVTGVKSREDQNFYIRRLCRDLVKAGAVDL